MSYQKARLYKQVSLQARKFRAITPLMITQRARLTDSVLQPTSRQNTLNDVRNFLARSKYQHGKKIASGLIG